MSILRQLLVVGLILMSACCWAAEKRLALVVGVGTYAHLPKLGNSIADARLVADKLRDDGFDVEFASDPTRDDLNKAVRDFGRRLAAAGGDTVALFYYAGHGVQDEKQVNYLIGSDADVQSQTDLPLEGMRLDNVLGTIEAAKPRMSFAVIDACRDNPLPASTSRGSQRGLAVEGERRGLLIAFSTEPGKTADDGPAGQNSPFATAFAEELQVPGLEAANLFRDVSRRVLDATNQEQFPWITQRLTDDFYFRPGAAPADKPPPTERPAAATLAPILDSADSGEVDYGRAVVANTPEGYSDWLARHPDHPRKASVIALLQRLNEQTLWDGAQASTSPASRRAALERLLLAFPGGAYAEAARTELGKLASAAARPDTAARPDDPPAVSAGSPKTGVVRATVIGLNPQGDNFLALKSEPNLQSPRLAKMGPGTVVSVLGHAGSWTHVQLRDGETGWAYNRYLAENATPVVERLVAPERPGAIDDHMPLSVVDWHDAHAVHTYSDRLHQYVFFYCRGTLRRKLVAIELPHFVEGNDDRAALEVIARHDSFTATNAAGSDLELHPLRRYVRSYTDGAETKTDVVLNVDADDWAHLRAAVRLRTKGYESDANPAVARRLDVLLSGDHRLFDQIDGDCLKD